MILQTLPMMTENEDVSSPVVMAGMPGVFIADVADYRTTRMRNSDVEQPPHMFLF